MDNNSIITDDKSIVIEFDRKELSLFSNSRADFMCTIRFKNNLGRLLKEISITEIEVGILIDNIYHFLETNQEVYYYINANSTNCINSVISIALEECNISGDKYWRDILCVYDYINGQMIPRFKTDITDAKIEFIDKLYNLYIGPSNHIENPLDYNPDFLK